MMVGRIDEWIDRFQLNFLCGVAKSIQIRTRELECLWTD